MLWCEGHQDTTETITFHNQYPLTGSLEDAILSLLRPAIALGVPSGE